MLQIAICDDILEQTVMLQKYIRQFCEKNGAEFKLHLYMT